MAGAYSDNQPDYSWCQPYEVKTFKHYWYPVRGLGAAKNANIDAAVNLELKEGRTATLAFNTTSEHEGARVALEANGKVVHEAAVDIGPAKPFRAQVAIPEDITTGALRASLRSKDGRELIAYRWLPASGHQDLPAPVKRPAPPGKVATGEELYLTGLRLEQLHSPAMEPAPYYEEAIRRDPGDYRANTALGILCLRQMRFADAEARLRAAVARASENYIRPKDGEASYYLGVSLRAQWKMEEALNSFERSAWSLGWHAAAKYAAAEIHCLRGDLGAALESVERSLSAGALNAKALHLEAALLRKLGRHVEAEAVASSALAQDPLDFRAANELYLARRGRGGTDGEAESILARLEVSMRGEVQSYLEMAVDYGNCGLWDEAIEVLERAEGSKLKKTREYPLVHYYLGHYCGNGGHGGEAKRHFETAAKMPPDFCFPLRVESIEALSEAMERNPADARAPYYLGNLLYDHQPERGIKEWERSAALEPGFAIVHRNLALAYSRVERDFPKAIAEMEKAVELNPGDSRYFYELDFLYEAGGVPAPKRMEMLERHQEVVAGRDDAFTRKIVLHIQLGDHDKALAMLAGRKFHNWEGKSEIHDVYVDACLQRGHARAAGGRYKEALQDYSAALEFPANLEVGKPYRERRLGQVHYFLGTAHEALGDSAEAMKSYEDAARRPERSPSEAQYYQALALRKLGRGEEAGKIFDGLVRQGLEEIESSSSVDYFAKFGERQTERARKAGSHFLAGLGYLGLGKDPEAREQLRKVLELDPYHLGARNVSRGDRTDSSK
jgi:tetratricopeptide (TPR) repeat protein